MTDETGSQVGRAGTGDDHRGHGCPLDPEKQRRPGPAGGPRGEVPPAGQRNRGASDPVWWAVELPRRSDRTAAVIGGMVAGALAALIVSVLARCRP